MREALFYEHRDDGSVLCGLCGQHCTIAQGKLGVCGVRENVDGVLYTAVYGMVAATNVDPIEKKPLFHMYPGSKALSLATVGCNFRCSFCQNWDLSQMSKGRNRRIAGHEVSAERIADMAVEHDCRVVAYTYSEPTIFYEWALDVSKLTTERGILNVFVTNGYMTAEALREIRPYLHGANVDLKAFRDETYRKTMGAPGVQPVLDTLKLMKQLGMWVEVTTLVVPTMNDSDEELRDIARFVAHELGPETPWHISRFYPDYKEKNLLPTPMQTLQRAYEIGREEGIRYVYTGNVPGDDTESTVCHKCGAMLIRRFGFHILEDAITKQGTCPKCDTPVAGVGMGQSASLRNNRSVLGQKRPDIGEG